MDHMNNSFRIKQINGKDTTDNYKQSPSNKFNPFSVEALKKVTPTNLKKNFDKINTSPIKVKSFKEDIGEDFFNERTADKTVNKNYTFTLPSGKENALNNSNFDIFPPNSNKFSSNKNFKLEPRNLCSPLRKADKSPSLNLLDSRNHLLVYSKQKKHSENKENEGCSSISSISNESSVNTHSALSTLRKINEEFKEDTTGEFADDDLEENEKAYLKLLLEQKKSLKVPEEKANDERFKVFKMKEMRRPSMPPNKSVRYYDQIVPDWKKDMQNGNLLINFSFGL